ncbi:hypothetical protein H1220_04235 [Carnobacteriaceae bacterium zg-84]|uniref:SHOCT domain-containing protein n=1 Tax=Granulicatella sp. zg-84 TaxID=2678503 RepID=UPI0013BEDDF9|nr:SHOCT domain-containing protein [Granulicatella sp. zg-84]NEW66028.1 hypothetical protein [Granulicatella sp. zg-84]QMI86561.1 hypothetical protein H1220_04235 [Carnobacteriaceae bacterium zg-84]
MNKNNELTFQITMTLVDNLIKNNLITAEEYELFKEKMIKKYEPKLGKLLILILDK